MTTSTAQIRRPGNAVRTMPYAARVPITAQHAVTTTVRQTVFQSRCAVRCRQTRCHTLAQPAPAASVHKNASGSARAPTTSKLIPSSALGDRFRRGADATDPPASELDANGPGRSVEEAVAIGRRCLSRAALVGRRARVVSQQLLLSQQADCGLAVPSSLIVIEYGCSLPKAVSGALVVTPEAIGYSKLIDLDGVAMIS